jgi:hypothetical protein
MFGSGGKGKGRNVGVATGRSSRRQAAALIVAMAVAGCSFSRESEETRIERELRAVATRAMPLRVDPTEPLVATTCRRTSGRVEGHALYLCTVAFKNTVVPDICAIVREGSVLVGGQEHSSHRCGAGGRFYRPQPDIFT